MSLKSAARRLVLVLALLGCGRSEVEKDSVESILLEPKFRIGEVDGEQALTEILGVAVGPSGLLYVSQWQIPHVTVFGPDGSVRRRIGQAGAGPGEFSSFAGRLGFLRDTLWVEDRHGVVFFDDSGNFLSEVEFRLPFEQSPWSYSPERYLDGGVLVAEINVRARDVADGVIRAMPILEVTEDGAILDTLALVAPPRDLARIILPDHHIYTRVPELGGGTYTYAADGSAIVVVREVMASDGEGLIRATWIDASGDTFAVREVTYTPKPFPTPVKERILSRMAESLAPSIGLTPARIRSAAAEQLSWPTYSPGSTAILVGTDRRLWMRREEIGDSARFERWSPDDATLEEVWLPADLELKYADDRQLWGVRKNSLDVPFLFRYEVVSGR